ncbi:MAG: hypothetical protein ACK40C_10565 [Novosphingobium meiothermophilum]
MPAVRLALCSLSIAGVIAASALASSRLEANAQTDPAEAQIQNLRAEVAGLRAAIQTLSGRIDAVDANMRTANRVLEISGTAQADAILLRPGNAGAASLLLGRSDATLRFQRIVLNGDDVSITASRTLTMKAPAIAIDGQQISMKESGRTTLKGSAVRDN